MAVYAADIISL